MVEVGGELKARGKNANGKIWRIGIEKPRPEIDENNRFQTVIELPNKALATSGSYRKFYMENGEKYAHTIDPHTGYPVKHKLLSVTVVTENTMLADAYATAFMVMGIKKTKNYLKHIQNWMRTLFIRIERGVGNVGYAWLFTTSGKLLVSISSFLHFSSALAPQKSTGFPFFI